LLGELGAIPGLDPEQANARGAVARFDRQLMVMQVTDTQENAAADLAVAELINAVLRALASGRWVSTYLQRAWSENDLLPIFLQTIKDAGNTLITNRDYLLMFGLMKQEQLSVQKLWQHLFVDLYGEISPEARQPIAHILEHGCLASRILRHTGRTPSPDKLRTVYRELADCTRTGRLFV
jgi:carboxylate-amine ligase